jgi:hypothetical protein
MVISYSKCERRVKHRYLQFTGNSTVDFGFVGITDTVSDVTMAMSVAASGGAGGGCHFLPL